MKIVYFVDHFRFDRTQRVLTQLVKAFNECRLQQAVVCLNNSVNEVILKTLHKAKTQVRIIGKLRLVSGLGELSIWRWMRQERFDVAVTFLF